MATDVDQAYQGWSQGELSDGDTSQEIPVSQMLDHGSISFGRFPIESLSWERRSVFTHNRCQEELEKFNGLVAKKKAYFEERYRRIRAMKAQQNVRQNQHTELTLDYGGDGSMSSQSGEEDGAASQHERFKDGASNNVHSIPEETKPGVTLEQEINCNEPPQERCFNPDSTLPNPDSSRGIPENTEQDKNTLDTTMLVQPMETESSLPLTGDLKETKSNSSSKLDNKEILLKPKSLESNIEPRRVAPDTKKIKSEQLQSIRKPLHHKSLSKDTKKTASSSGMTSRRGPETKRLIKKRILLTSFKNLKEVKKKPLAVDSHYANLKKIEAHVLGPPKSRSSELPARNKSICNVGTEPHIATAEGMKRKEGNARMREFQRGTIKTTGPSKSGNMPMDTKQALAGRGADVSRGGSKSKLDDPSLDGRKTSRRETPHWR
nr:PREDICTED: protein WVD2-like 7 isoform X7 [Musa acuminata subsp. malaccensis]